MRLLREVINPPIASYIATLPECHSGFTSGVDNGMRFSEIAELIDFAVFVRSQRQLLRKFVKTEDRQDVVDKYFVVTFESLIGKKARNYAGFRAFTAIYCLTIPDAGLFPLNRRRWFAGYVVSDAINAAYFVDNAA